MTDTFVDALKIPAVLSTLRKIQMDCGDSLRVLHGYKARRDSGGCTMLTGEEQCALENIFQVTLEQTITATILFLLAEGAFIAGGVLLGQTAQLAISLNTMSAPGKQGIHPGKRLAETCPRAVPNVLQMLRIEDKSRLAMAFGAIAGASGYFSHQGPPTVSLHQTEPAKRCRPLLILAQHPSLDGMPSGA